MLTKQNYKLLGEVKFLNKSDTASKYYSVSFGGVKIKVRVSDHYNSKWKGDLQIVVFNPNNIDTNNIKWRSYETLKKVYDKKYRKTRMNETERGSI